MKYLVIVLIVFSFSANAQTDSSQLNLPIKLTLKVKIWKQIGYYLTVKSNFSDTVLKCVGSGNLNDSLSSGTIRAGRFVQFLEKWFGEESGTNYDLLNELATSTAAQGGLLPQLNVIINSGSSTASQKQIAAWLKTQVQSLFTRKTAVGTERGTIGFQNLQNLGSNISD